MICPRACGPSVPLVRRCCISSISGSISMFARAAGITFYSSLVSQGEYNELSGLRAVNQLLENRQHFTAIFAGNDQMAFGAGLGLQRQGFRVPDDVSLVGFDDLPSAMYAIPPLSTVHQPAYEVGRLAASALLQLLAGNPPDVSIPAPRLIARESSRRILM